MSNIQTTIFFIILSRDIYYLYNSRVCQWCSWHNRTYITVLTWRRFFNIFIYLNKETLCICYILRIFCSTQKMCITDVISSFGIRSKCIALFSIKPFTFTTLQVHEIYIGIVHPYTFFGRLVSMLFSEYGHYGSTYLPLLSIKLFIFVTLLVSWKYAFIEYLATAERTLQRVTRKLPLTVSGEKR